MTITYSKQVLLKRGNASVVSTYTGPLGELVLNTDTLTVGVHDGATAGGHSVASAVSVSTANTAMKGYVDGQISTIIAGAPGALDTLNELANALGNNASFSTTITNSLATLTSNAAVQSGLIADTNTAIGTANTAMKGYVDGQISTVTNSVTGANAAIVTANTAMKGYVDAGAANLVNGSYTVSLGADGTLTLPDSSKAQGVLTSTFTGTIAGTTLTVTGCTPGVISIGQYVEGVGVVDDTYAVEQLTGTSGGNGTYRVTVDQNIGPIEMYVAAMFFDSSIKLAEGHGIYQQDEHDLRLYNLLIGITAEEATVHIGDRNTNGLSLTNDQEYKIESNLNPGTYMAVARVDTGDNITLGSGNANSTQIRVGGDTLLGGYALKFTNGGNAHIPAGVRIGTSQEYSADSTLNPGTHLAIGAVDTTDNVILSDGNSNTTQIKVGGMAAKTFKYGAKFFNGGTAHIPEILRIGNNINSGNYGANLEITSSAYAGASFASYKDSTGDQYGSFVYGTRFHGNLNYPTAVTQDDWIMEFGAGAWDGTNLNGGGELAWRVDGAVSAGVNPSRAEIYVTPQGTANQTLGLVIDSNLTVKTFGRLQIGATVPATSKGAIGDKANMMAVGGGFLYVCITDYTTGSADIWSRTAITATTW